ncbi:MAG: sodium-dependent transporter [Lachnospiraceae bacterium]|nr:sodium-dependent transporter [Lachnospiraceae bacterium]
MTEKDQNSSLTFEPGSGKHSRKKHGSGSFTGQIGFVLAAAGSAVGVGNLWRFPYLAAKDGGGLFIIVYILLAVTFGFTLLTSDIAIGRRTGKNSVRAYEEMHPRWKFLGILTFLVPVIIMTYYAVIGGWITKYISVYISGPGLEAAEDGYFTAFITSPAPASVFAVIFMLVTAFVVYNGVERGIERLSRVLMPVLLVMIIAIAIFALTLRHTDESGVTRTGLMGLLVYLKPDFTGLTPGRFLQILLDAMSQIFFSLSVSMGIMITYGSYVKKEVDISTSVRQIEWFDTGIALLAGIMIIPSIFVFEGVEGMKSGPGLMFVSLPKVFAAMGGIGQFVGLAFFLMAAFAALTSCVSVLEAITANCMEIFHTERRRTTLVLTVIYTAASVAIALGYSTFYLELPMPGGGTGQLLDIMDYISNSFMMPFISLLSSILIGWVIGPKWIVKEVEYGGRRFRLRSLYTVMIRYIVPVIMLILFLKSAGILGH